MPRARTFPTRFGSSTSGVPWRTTASMTVHQHTPSSRATTATGQGELAHLAGGFSSGSQREHGPRSDVFGALGPRLCPHSPHRHSATAASSTPAVPDVRSRAGPGCRPAPGPWPPHAHRRSDTRRCQLSSRRSRSPRAGVSSTASTAESVESQQRLGQAGSVLHCQRSSSLGRRATTTMSGPLAAFVDTSLRYAPHFNAKSQLTAGSSYVPRTDLGRSAPASRKCPLVKCRELYGPRWCWVNQNGLGPEIRPLVAEMATQETAPIGHLVLLGVLRSELPDVGVDSRCDRSVTEVVSGGVDGC